MPCETRLWKPTEPRKLIFEIVDEVIPLRVQEYLQPADGSEPDYDGFLQWINTTFPLGLSRVSAQFETRTPKKIQFLDRPYQAIL